MNALKDLRINWLKDLKINGLGFLKINELKHFIPKLGDRDDIEMGDLIKSKEKVEIQIRKLVRERKELESWIGQLQETEDRKNEVITDKEMSEFPWREEIFPPLRRNMNNEVPRFIEVETDALQKEDAGISERIDSEICKKVEESDKSLESKETSEIKEYNITEIEVKEEANCASEKNDVKSNEEAELSNIVKRSREIDFPENTDKIKTVDPVLKDNEKGEDKTPALENNEKEEDRKSEKEKTDNENPASGTFGNILIQELLESEDLCPEEEQNFMKYIQESSVAELITDLREVKSILAGQDPASLI